jgi:hypothetical protein
MEHILDVPVVSILRRVSRRCEARVYREYILANCDFHDSGDPPGVGQWVLKITDGIQDLPQYEQRKRSTDDSDSHCLTY